MLFGATFTSPSASSSLGSGPPLASLFPQAPSSPESHPALLLPATIALDQQHLILGSPAPPGTSPAGLADSKEHKE